VNLPGKEPAAMATTTAQAPLGLFDTESLIGWEDLAIRDTVSHFVENRIKPEVADWFESASIPVRDLAKDLGSLGVLGMHLQGYGWAGTSATACRRGKGTDRRRDPRVRRPHQRTRVLRPGNHEEDVAARLGDQRTRARRRPPAGLRPHLRESQRVLNSLHDGSR
jgi:hypothetical protein